MGFFSSLFSTLSGDSYKETILKIEGYFRFCSFQRYIDSVSNIKN